jgi:hypothetical protein
VELELGAHDEGQRPLRPAHEADKVYGVRIDESVETVAGDAAEHLWKPKLYLVAVTFPYA